MKVCVLLSAILVFANQLIIRNNNNNNNNNNKKKMNEWVILWFICIVCSSGSIYNGLEVFHDYSFLNSLNIKERNFNASYLISFSRGNTGPSFIKEKEKMPSHNFGYTRADLQCPPPSHRGSFFTLVCFLFCIHQNRRREGDLHLCAEVFFWFYFL